MNFLAHFLLTRPDDTPELQLGALLPDIAKRAGVLIKPAQLAEVHPQYSDFKDGIELHWKADQIFHNSELFAYGMELWKRHLHPEIPKGISKTFFLYHLLFEMWLDRVLMKQQPGADQKMYIQLAKVSTDHLREFALEVLDDNNARLLKSFNGFQKRQFVSLYARPQAFAEIAIDVFNHVTDQKLPGDFEQSIRLIMSHMDEDVHPILGLWRKLIPDIVP